MIPDNGVQSYLNGQNDFDCDESFIIGPGGSIGTFGPRTSPPAKRGPIRNSLGSEISTCEFTILCGGGSGLQADVLAGNWDNQIVRVTRTFGPYTISRFVGYVASAIPTSMTIVVVAKSMIAELNQKLPTRIFSSMCPLRFGSTACGATGTPCDHTVDGCVTPFNFGGFPMRPPDDQKFYRPRTTSWNPPIVGQSATPQSATQTSAVDDAVPLVYGTRWLPGKVVFRDPTVGLNLTTSNVGLAGMTDTWFVEDLTEDQQLTTENPDVIKVWRKHVGLPAHPQVVALCEGGSGIEVRASKIGGKLITGAGRPAATDPPSGVVPDGLAAALPIPNDRFVVTCNAVFNEGVRLNLSPRVLNYKLAVNVLPNGTGGDLENAALRMHYPVSNYEYPVYDLITSFDGGIRRRLRWPGTAVIEWIGLVVREKAVDETFTFEQPEMEFEVRGLCRSGTNDDADPAEVMADLWARCGMSGVTLDIDHGMADGASYRSYCSDQGFRVANVISSQTDAWGLMSSLAADTNAGFVWTQSSSGDPVLRVIPLVEDEGGGQSTATSLGPQDFVTADVNGEGVRVERRPDQESFSIIPVKYQMHTQKDGEVDDSVLADDLARSMNWDRRGAAYAAQWVSNSAHAYKLSHLLAHRSAQCRNLFRFSTTARWIRLECGDLISLTEPHLGISGVLARIVSTEDTSDGDIDIVAEEYIGHAAVTPPVWTPEGGGGGGGGGIRPPGAGGQLEADLQAIENLLGDIISDNRITTAEKHATVPLLQQLFGEHQKLYSDAAAFGASVTAQTLADYESAIHDLWAYCIAAVPTGTDAAADDQGVHTPTNGLGMTATWTGKNSWPTGHAATDLPPTNAVYNAWTSVGDANGTITVHGNTFRDKIGDAFATRQILVIEITATMRDSIEALQTLNRIGDDGYLAYNEKRAAYSIYRAWIEGQAGLDAAAGQHFLPTGSGVRKTYNDAIGAMETYWTQAIPTCAGVSEGHDPPNPKLHVSSSTGLGLPTAHPSESQVHTWMQTPPDIAIDPARWRTVHSDAANAIDALERAMLKDTDDRLAANVAWLTRVTSDSIISQGAEKMDVFEEYVHLLDDATQIRIRAQNAAIATACASDLAAYNGYVATLTAHMTALGLPGTSAANLDTWQAATASPNTANRDCDLSLVSAPYTGRNALITNFKNVYSAYAMLETSIAGAFSANVAQVNLISSDGCISAGAEKAFAWITYKGLIDDQTGVTNQAGAQGISLTAGTGLTYANAMAKIRAYMAAPHVLPPSSPADGRSQTSPTNGLNMGRATDGTGTGTALPTDAQVSTWSGYNTYVHGPTFRAVFQDAIASANAIWAAIENDSWADANDALNRLTNIGSDGVLTRDEKPAVWRDYHLLLTERAQLEAQATATASLTADTTATLAAYRQRTWELQNYLYNTLALRPAPGAGTPTWTITIPTYADLNGTSPAGWLSVGTANGVAGDTAIPNQTAWLDAWTNLYAARAALLTAIATSMGQDVSDALAWLGNVANDLIVSRGEKTRTFSMYQSLVVERGSLDQEATYNAAMTTATATEKAAYDRTVWQLQDYMMDGLACPPDTTNEVDATPWAVANPSNTHLTTWLASGSAGGIVGDTALPATWTLLGTAYPDRQAFLQAFLNVWSARAALTKKMNDTRNGWSGGTHPRTGTWISASDLANEAAIAAWDAVNNAAAGASAAFARAAALNRARYGLRGAAGVAGTRLGTTTGVSEGDQWFETDYQYHPWVWVSGSWRDALQAIPVGAAYNKTYYVATLVERDALTGLLVGDLCFVSGLNYASYRVASIGPTVWTSLVPAGTQGLTTYSGTTAPANPIVGDLWWDTTGGANIPKRCTSVGPPALWQDLSQPAQPDGIHTWGPTATEPATAVVGDIWYDSSSTPPLTKRCTAVGPPKVWSTIAGNKITSSPTAPANPILGDIWVDTTGGGNIFKTCTAVGPPAIWLAQGSGNTVWTQATVPAAAKAGDLWYDTSTTPTTLKAYGGSGWSVIWGPASLPPGVLNAGALPAGVTYSGPITPSQVTTGTLSAGVVYAGAVAASQITAGTLAAGVVYAGAVTAGQITAGTLAAGVIYAGSVAADKILAGTLAAGVVYAGTISADRVTAGTLAAGVIYVGALTASQVNAVGISASSITTGTLAATIAVLGTVQAGQIQAGTISAQVGYYGSAMVGMLSAGHINSQSIGTGTITADNIYAGAITANKLTLIAGGAALNVDPRTSDATAWYGNPEIRYASDGALKAPGDGRTDTTCLRGTNGLHALEMKKVPVQPNTWYRVRCRIRRSASSSASGFLRLYRYNEAGTEIGYMVGRTKANNTYYEAVPATNIAVATAWTEWVGYVLTEATAVSAVIGVILNYNLPTGYMEAQDVSFEEMVDASLVVDGSITAKSMTLVDFENLWPNGLCTIAPPAGYVSPDPSTDPEFGYWQDSGDASAAETHRLRRYVGSGVLTFNVPASAGDEFCITYDQWAANGADRYMYLAFKDSINRWWNGSAWVATEAEYAIAQGTVNSAWEAKTLLSARANAGGAPPGTTKMTVAFGTWGGTVSYLAKVLLRRRNNANLIVDGAITANKISADALQTSNYTEDGNGYPTLGAKLDKSGTSIKTHRNGLRLGRTLIGDAWFSRTIVQTARLYRSSGTPTLYTRNGAATPFYYMGTGFGRGNSGYGIRIGLNVVGATFQALYPGCTYANVSLEAIHVTGGDFTGTTIHPIWTATPAYEATYALNSPDFLVAIFDPTNWGALDPLAHVWDIGITAIYSLNAAAGTAW
jgi:hypothetical protein